MTKVLQLLEIKQRHRAKGDRADWFAPSATRFFNSAYPRYGYREGDTVYFVTSERFDMSTPRRYSIRVMDWKTGWIDTLCDFQRFDTRREAYAEMRKAMAEAARSIAA